MSAASRSDSLERLVVPVQPSFLNWLHDVEASSGTHRLDIVEQGIRAFAEKEGLASPPSRLAGRRPRQPRTAT